jgi:hypothetical protein
MRVARSDLCAQGIYPYPQSRFRLLLARIFHSLHHRYDHLSARVTCAGGGRKICGLDSKPPLRRGIKLSNRLRKDCWLRNASKSCLALCGAFWGGFASSPDAPACRPGPRIADSLHVGCRLECETSGLAASANKPFPFRLRNLDIFPRWFGPPGRPFRSTQRARRSRPALQRETVITIRARRLIWQGARL